MEKEKNNDCIEFKSRLNHWKQIPLLHNTVLIYAMKELDWLAGIWFLWRNWKKVSPLILDYVVRC